MRRSIFSSLITVAGLAALSGCSGDENVASGTRGYLDSCTSTSECGTGLTCNYGVCTHHCSSGCSDDAECVTQVDLCLPPEIADTLRGDGGMPTDMTPTLPPDMFVPPARDAGPDAPATTPTELTACGTPNDTATLFFDGAGTEYPEYYPGYAHVESTVTSDGVAHVLFTVGEAPASDITAETSVFHASLQPSGWVIETTDYMLPLDNNVAVGIVAGEGSEVYGLLRETDCWNGSVCRTALVRIETGHPTTSMLLDIFEVPDDLGMFIDAEPHVISFKRDPASKEFHVIGVLKTDAMLYSVRISASGEVLSRDTFTLRGTGHADSTISDVSNLVTLADGSIALIVSYFGEGSTRFVGQLTTGNALEAHDLALAGPFYERTFSRRILQRPDATGIGFTALYEACTLAGSGDDCSEISIVSESVNAAGVGSGSTAIVTSYDEGTTDFANVLDDYSRYGDPDNILLEQGYRDYDAAISVPTVLTFSGSTYSSNEWPQAELEGVDNMRASHLVVSGSTVFGALQTAVTTTDEGSFPVAYFRGCH